MFIDEIVVNIKAGNGGDGCTSFRREKYVAFGGPDGGNGGRGADIVFKADSSFRTLLDFKYNKNIKGPKGVNGMGKNMYGKNAETMYFKIPTGTVIIDEGTGLILADLNEHGMQYTVCKGGRGGRGNAFFKTSKNNAPDFSEYGEPGEERRVKLELKLLADVGLVGLPSVGKSTILSMITRAKPKIGAYHFTTLVPQLGVASSSDGRSFVVADLPGLIEGAALGKGLGDEFLKHIERTRIIAHIIDMSGIEDRNPIEDYNTILKELKDYNLKLLNKKQIVIANKKDVETFEENLKAFKKEFNVEVFEVSAINNEGLTEVVNAFANILDETVKEELYKEDEYESHVLYKFEKEEPFNLYKEDENSFVLRGDYIEKIFKMTKFASDADKLRFANKIKKLGVEEKLKELGVKDGDIVRILNFEFEYME
ncbi:MAG: GTPase ObgE [Bacilli bacterium]